MSGVRVHARKTPPRLARWLSMAEVAELMGLEGKEAPRQVRVQLLRIQTHRGVTLMWKAGETKQSPWYTTRALIAKHAPEMLETDHESAEAIRQLRSDILVRLEKVDEYVRELERETRASFRRLTVKLRANGVKT